ncbi:MAG: DUF1127 domain-containing protein [Pseudomonadota bacterium]
MSLLSTIKGWLERQRTYNELSGLTRHELRDIGIEGDLDSFFRARRNRK